MRFWMIVEYLLVVTALILVVTQVVAPLVLRRPLFPMFRKRRNELEAQIAEANEARDEKELEQELASINRSNRKPPHRGGIH